jgi:Zn-dependent M32 family carboxypeptidase
MSKYQTLDTLKGNKTINVNEYFRERWGKLEEFKNYFGSEQTGVDEKFFNEKQYTLREQEDLFRVFAESLGFDRDIKSLDIHISFSKKSEETV